MKPMPKVLIATLAVAALAAGAALAASSPSVVTQSATNVSSTGAQLNATINPNGSATTYYFEWGPSKTYGFSTKPGSLAKGTTVKPVSAKLSGLTPGTTYHFRVDASNSAGTALGSDRTFKTSGHPPAGVTTGPASQIGPFSVTLSGTVNPNGQATQWEFDYGLTTQYTARTFGGTVAASSSQTTVTEMLQGLEPGTVFHYRLVGLHGSSVVSDGGDQTFMTLPYPRPVPRVSVTIAPRRARTKPYTFTTFGTVSGPSRFASLDCFGSASIRFVLGSRVLQSELATLQPNCTFSAQNVFRRLPGRGPKNRQVRLRVLVHWRGNGYLAPSDARPQTIVLG